jgi:hypothetical protein
MASDPATEAIDADELRTRVDQLEREHHERIARANAALAAAQDRSYWLERWGVDLNALMRRPGAAELRAALRALRVVLRLRHKLVHETRALPARAALARQAVGEERGRGLDAGSADYPDVVAESLAATGVEIGELDRVLDLGSDPDRDAIGEPPLPYDDEAFDAVVATSIGSQFAEQAALDWFAELHRIVRPGGRLLVSCADTALLSPEWIAAKLTPEWRVALFRPGRVEPNQDVYVLERS